MDEEIDWKEVARRALDHIDSLLLYVNYLEDSYPTEAMGFLVQVKEAIGDKTKPRMAGAIKPREPFFPLPRLNPPSADPGIPVHPTALVEKGIPGLATIPERPAQCPICGELYAPSNAQDAAFHSGMHYRPATDDVLGKDGE